MNLMFSDALNFPREPRKVMRKGNEASKSRVHETRSIKNVCGIYKEDLSQCPLVVHDYKGLKFLFSGKIITLKYSKHRRHLYKCVR